MGRHLAAFVVLAVACVARADELKNWFGDPYFQVRHAVPDCPAPRGPFMSESDMRLDAHARAERGTRCWLEGKCTKSNAYLYDAGIAEAVRKRFSESREFASSSLWVTVQRRIVWVEGCVAGATAAQRITRLVRAVPDVEQVIVNVMPAAGGRPSYPVGHP